MTDAHVSEFLPPIFREALMDAASAGDIARIDRITAELAERYPDLVRKRSDVRPGYQSVKAFRAERA